MYEEAVNAYEQEYSARQGKMPRRLPALRKAYETSGMHAYWRKRIDLMKERYTRTYISPIWIAMNYTNLGDKERAFEWLEKSYEERSGWLLELKIDPTLGSSAKRSPFPGVRGTSQELPPYQQQQCDQIG